MPTVKSKPSFSVAMQRACFEARQWMGATSPNPPVGACALDENGNILATGAHHRAGEAHAEAELLKICREQGLLTHIDSVAVTLEPCNHHGKTPPCSEALISAGVRKIIVGVQDPNTGVKGGGIERLRQAGIEVIEGIEADACQKLIHAFSFYSRTQKPFVTVKRAFDPSGSMIPTGGKKTFTSQASLILAHRLRKKADALVTGSGTVLADTPLFSVRHVQDHEGKRRILAILDRQQRVASDYIDAASKRGFDVRLYSDIDLCFSALAEAGIQDVLVEAGPRLSDAILSSNHWAMCVDIHKAQQDKIDVFCNKSLRLPFNTDQLNIEDFLPL